MHDFTEGVSCNASSTAAFNFTSLPRRQPPSAVTTSLHCASLMRSTSAVLEKPPKTTECVAPMRAHASIEIANSGRSEEHTSELQSHLNLVCRLLLEKKKTHTPLR